MTAAASAGGEFRRDRWGAAVSTADEDALRWWDQAVGELVAFTGDPGASARAALAADAGFGEARAFCAYIELYAQTIEGIEAARLLLEGAGAAAEDTRGLRHLEAARAWTAGELERAASCLEGALLADPHDLLALRVVEDLYFFVGDGRSLRASAARVAAEWSPSEPGWGHVQGMRSFGLEEAGDYRKAEAAALAALDTDPADVWAIHTLAHVAEMEGHVAHGLDQLHGRVGAWGSSYFAVHNWWHVGLYRIAAGELAEAVALYDGTIRAGDSTAWLDLVDAASLLWRLALCGVDVTDRAARLVDVLVPVAGSGISAFNDWHATMVFGLARRQDLCGRVLAGLGRAKGTNARVVVSVGRTVIEAFARYSAGEHGAAAEALFAARPQAQALGGSHAQRDVIDQTLIAAAASSGRTDLVRALSHERLDARPGGAEPLGRLIAAHRTRGGPL